MKTKLVHGATVDTPLPTYKNGFMTSPKFTFGMHGLLFTKDGLLKFQNHLSLPYTSIIDNYMCMLSFQQELDVWHTLTPVITNDKTKKSITSPHFMKDMPLTGDGYKRIQYIIYVTISVVTATVILLLCNILKKYN